MKACMWLVRINCIIYVISCFLVDPTFLFLSNGSAWYTLITSMFLHSGLLHLLGNMLVLVLFSFKFEKVVGTKYYLYIYFISGIVGGIFSLYFGMVPTIGASGAIAGIIAASLINIIKNWKYLIRTHKRAKWTIWFGYALVIYLSFIMLAPSLGTPGINNVAHFSGFISGAIAYCIIERKEKWYEKMEKEIENA